MKQASLNNLKPQAAMKGESPKVRLSLSIDPTVKDIAKNSGDNISELVENFLRAHYKINA